TTRTGTPRPGSADLANGPLGDRGHAAANGHTATGRPGRLTRGDPLHAGDVDHQAAREPARPADGAAAAAVLERAAPRTDAATPNDRRFASEPTPRDAHEDVMRRARELRERQRKAGGTHEQADD